MTSTQRGGEEVLKFVMCLWILLILINRSIVHFQECGWVTKLVIFCRRHNYVTPNVEKVTFLALVLVFIS